MEIVKLSAKSIREKVLNKEITCEEVVKAFIEQIEKNKEYNAVLEVFSDAVDYAKEIDKQIAKKCITVYRKEAHIFLRLR